MLAVGAIFGPKLVVFATKMNLKLQVWPPTLTEVIPVVATMLSSHITGLAKCTT